MEIIVAVVFLINKVLLFMRKPSGWFAGAIAGALSVSYFFGIGLYIYSILELGTFFQMGAQFLFPSRKSVERTVDCLVIVIMTAIAFMAFAGALTIAELSASVGFLIGTKLLSKAKTERTGWLIYAFVHLLTGFVFFEKEQFFFFGTQVISVAIAVLAVVRKNK